MDGVTVYRSGPQFPSEKHYEQLKAKGFEGRVLDADLWWWHAYDYGWRRIILQTRADNSPIDLGRAWRDPQLAANAEVFYAEKFGKKAPDIETHRPPPTPEQIDHVERCRELFIANVQAYLKRNRAAWGEVHDETRTALKRAHEALGVTVQEVPKGE